MFQTQKKKKQNQNSHDQSYAVRSSGLQVYVTGGTKMVEKSRNLRWRKRVEGLEEKKEREVPGRDKTLFI